MASPSIAEVPARDTAVLSRSADCWLMGGASIALWLVMRVGQAFRESSEMIDGHFLQVGALFSLMSILCNHPHFMISYRFGYGRGARFVFSHWLALIAVPAALAAFYVLSYLRFDSQISGLSWVRAINHVFEGTNLAFRLGTQANLGMEVLSLSVLLMNLTVGWHYSKQVFGCMMVYAYYDHYPLSSGQRGWLKASLLSVACLNFVSIAAYPPGSGGVPGGKAYFFNVPLTPLGLPETLPALATLAVGACTVGSLFWVFVRNWRLRGVLPSANFIVPWLAFYVWWLPLSRQAEFYLAAVPFFHSLQYLPFAYRIEAPAIARNRWHGVNQAARVALLLAVGFSAFELVPNLLDRGLETNWYLKTWFFTITFAVFINIHHFFIDSVVWKFDQRDVRRNLLVRRAG